MPERHFKIQWPDGFEEICYSPSSTIDNYLNKGQEYSVADFLDIADKALNEASERVRQKYGYACSSARDQLELIKERGGLFQNKTSSFVTVLDIK